jgi:hypothetical protein
MDAVRNVDEFGAVGDGVADDSAAFNRALTTAHAVSVTGGKIYKIKDVTVDTHRILDGRGAVFRAAPGASFVFKLTGFAPTLENVYVTDDDHHVSAASALVLIDDATYPVFRQSKIVNSNTAIRIRASSGRAGGITSKGTIESIRIDAVDSAAVFVETDVAHMIYRDIIIYTGYGLHGGPKPAVTGVIVDSRNYGPAGTIGGHYFDHVHVLECETGFDLRAMQLSYFSHCIADGLKGTGYQIVLGCQRLWFGQCFAGTCDKGVGIYNASIEIYLNGLATILIGIVPPWYLGPPGQFFATSDPVELVMDDNSTAWLNDQQWNGGPKRIRLTNGAVLSGVRRRRR